MGCLFLALQDDLQVYIIFDFRSFHMASARQNLSSGFLTKRDSNQSPQIQGLAREMKFHLKQVKIWYFPQKE